MNRYLSIDVLRGLIMIIMALDHVIGGLSVHPETEASLTNNMFPGYISEAQRWSRLLTHLCAPGFQLLAGMGLAISVARALKNNTSQFKISFDLITRGVVLILADFLLMLPVFKLPLFFMVFACIGACTLCFSVLRFLPRDLIGIVGLAIILTAPLYGPTEQIELTGKNYLLAIWTNVGFGSRETGMYGILYPILPWLGIFAIGWWIGMKLFEAPKEQPVSVSAKWFCGAGLFLIIAGLALRALDWRPAEGIPLKQAGILDPTFWQFTKYPPSLVFIALTVGVLLFLLGLLRLALDRSNEQPVWARIVSVYGRTAFFYFVVHFYLIGFLAMYLGVADGHAEKYSIGAAYLAWVGVVIVMWPLCYGYDKLRQRFRTVLRYF